MNATIEIRESGYKFEVEVEKFLAELSQYGDDPREYSNNVNDFEWSSDLSDAPEGWPEHLPVWSYRPS